MVRRGRDEADTGSAVTGLGNPRVHFCAGQIAALAGLGALCQLDLDLLCRDKILAGDAEAGGSHLLYLGIALAVVALFRLTALAGVAPAAEAVQRDGDGLVGLAAQCAVAHGSGLEPLDDGAHRLYLVQRDAAVGGIVEVQQTAQMDAVLAHVVHGVGELLEGVVVTGEAGFLE